MSVLLLMVLLQGCQASSAKKENQTSQQALAISAPIDGFLKELLVSEGQNVEQGQVLILIDTTKIALQRAYFQSEINRINAAIQSPAQPTAALRAKLGNLYYHQGQYESKSISEVSKEDRIQLDYEIIHTREELVTLQKEIEQRNSALKYELQGIEIQMQILDQEIKRHVLRAPIAGEIMGVEVYNGKWLDQGSRLLSIQGDSIQ